MLVVPQREYQELEVDRASAAKSVAGKLRPGKKTLVLALAGFFLAGVVIAAEWSILLSQGFEIAAVEQEISQLNIQNERLKLQSEQLKSPERLEQIAVNELGMRYPAQEEIQVVAAEELLKGSAGSFKQEPLAMAARPAYKDGEKPLLAEVGSALQQLFFPQQALGEEHSR